MDLTIQSVQYIKKLLYNRYISSFKIKHLLSHTSGLPDLRDIRNNRDFYLTAKDLGNFAPLKQVDKLNFQPGEKFSYSNPAYNGLALIIEKVTGKPWQNFIVTLCAETRNGGKTVFKSIDRTLFKNQCF